MICRFDLFSKPYMKYSIHGQYNFLKIMEKSGARDITHWKFTGEVQATYFHSGP